MMFNDAEYNVLLAALRTCAVSYAVAAQEEDKFFRKRKAAAYQAFGKACGELSDRMERERPSKTLIKPQ